MIKTQYLFRTRLRKTALFIFSKIPSPKDNAASKIFIDSHLLSWVQNINYCYFAILVVPTPMKKRKRKLRIIRTWHFHWKTV